MVYEKGKLEIRDALKQKDLHLWEKLERIWNESFNESVGNSKDVALKHSLSVEQNISSLIPDDWKLGKLNALELFILSASACLHDIDKGWKITGKLHGEISAGEIRLHFSRFGLDAGQADLIGWIIKVHDHGDFSFDLPEEPIAIGVTDINIRSLAALFKLADILHADYNRVDGENPITPKDRARFCIRGWKYDLDGKIRFSAEPEKITDLEHIHRAIAMIRKDLEKIAFILRESGYPYEIALTEIDESKLIYITQSEKMGDRSFLGMDSFSEDDQHIFKGRVNKSHELYQMLLTNDPVIALIGDSGIGKTSLIRAGLFPILRKAGWRFAYIRVLHDDINEVMQKIWLQIMRDDLPDNIDFVHSLKFISEKNHHINNLIIFDQFEEVLDFDSILKQIRNILYHVQAMRFRNIKVILCYRSDFEGQIGPILQDIAYSLRSISRLYLGALDIEGARDALMAGMNAACVGFDPNIGSEDFSEIILRDIEGQGKSFYPPYIQMVGETLKDSAIKEQYYIIQKTLYDSLNGVSGIIGDYLFKQLDSFGIYQKDAENILIELTNVLGNERIRSRIRSILDLKAELGLNNDVLKKLLHEMSSKWLIRDLGSGRYELIHDQLAKQVVDKLIISRKEFGFKQLRDHLCTISLIYPNMSVILDTKVMARIYLYRERINPDNAEKLILFHSCIAKQGPAWYWLRNIESEEYYSLLNSGLSNQSISPSIIKLIGLSGDERMVDRLIELTKKSDEVACYAMESLGRIKSKKAIPILIDKLDNKNIFIKVAAIKSLSNLGAREAIPKLIDIIGSKEQNIKRIALDAYSNLVMQDDIPKLMELLASDGLQEKKYSIKGLLRLRGIDFMPNICKMLKDKNRFIRIMAIEAMKEISENLETNSLPNENLRFIGFVKSNLYQMLQDRSRDVRISASKILAQLSSYDDISELKLMIESDITDIKILASMALARLGYSEGINILREIFRKNGRKGKMALDVLIELGYREIIPDLIEMIGNENPVIRNMAVKGLGALGTEAELPVLL